MSKLRNQLNPLHFPAGTQFKWWSPSSWELHVIVIKFNVYASSVYPKACFLSYPGFPWGAIHNDPTLLLPKRTLTVFERLTFQLTSIVKNARCGSEQPRSQVSLRGNEVEKWNAQHAGFFREAAVIFVAQLFSVEGSLISFKLTPENSQK